MKKLPCKKFITQKIALALIDIAKEEENQQFLKSYWNTSYCFDRIKTDGKKAYGNYCRNRFCLCCSANRKADLINKYFPIVTSWHSPHFLTLTRKSFSADELYNGVRQTKKDLRTIIRRCQKRHLRGKGPKIECIVSLESNFNPIEKTYNPHFHIITKSKEIGILLNVEWLRQLGKENANFFAQKLIKIDDKEHTLKEVELPQSLGQV